MHAIEEQGVWDVAIIGCGPVGVTLAGLLGREGVRVGVFDKAGPVYAQPRAVGFDHDAMRLFQRLGVAQALAPHITDFRNTVYLGTEGQPIQHVCRIEPPYPYSWAPNYTCDQPGVEAVLRAAVVQMPTVRLHLGHELLALDAGCAEVQLSLRDAQGRNLQHRARWVVGCDGASSVVRRQAGLTLESLDYDEPWIVVDLKVAPEHLASLPQTNVQYCEPQRPCTYIVCPGNHRRWEFMLMPGEPREGALSPERLWALLARWLQPQQAQLWRAAAYRFHALVANEWRAGRLLLAGDSAHQTPPFMGQGMCQGLRDAGNLAWKLAAVLRGELDASLLDSYTAERRPHVQATTRMAKQLGLMLSERDPQRARERDAQLLREGGGQAPVLVRQQLIPALAHGLIAAGTPRVGEAFPQPRVRIAGREWLLDDVLGAVWRLVLGDAADGELPSWRELARRHGLTLQCIDRSADTQGLLHSWLAEAGLRGALVRPDHGVYGGFRSRAEAQALLQQRAAALQPQLDHACASITTEGDSSHVQSHRA